jgi:hypothetical protein
MIYGRRKKVNKNCGHAHLRMGKNPAPETFSATYKTINKIQITGA